MASLNPSTQHLGVSKSAFPAYIKIAWPKKYVDIENVTVHDDDRAAEADRTNEERHKHNAKIFDQINTLLDFLEMPKLRVRSPQSYQDMVDQLYRQWMANREAKLIDAIKYLAHRKKFAEKDYVLEDAVDMANKIAVSVEKKRIMQEHEQRIPLTVNNEDNATKKEMHCKPSCNATWDGIGPTCFCGNLAATWYSSPTHSFLKPDVEAIGY